MTQSPLDTALIARLIELRDHPEPKAGLLVDMRGVEHGDDPRFTRSLHRYLESWAAPQPTEAFHVLDRRLLILAPAEAAEALARGAAALVDVLRRHGFGEAAAAMYDLKTQAARLLGDLSPRGRDRPPPAPAPVVGAPVSNAALGKLLDVEHALSGVNIEPLLREETVWSFADPAAPEAILTELAISLDELEARLDVSLRRDDWLRHEATEILDRSLLRHIARDRSRSDRRFSFDLHVATVLDDGFAALAHAVPSEIRARLTVELASWDVGFSVERFAAAAGRLADLGFGVAVDRAPLEALKTLETDGVDLAYVKAAWPVAAPPADATERLAAGVARFGVERLILWRCATPAALTAGRAAGVALFQGRAADLAAASVAAGRLEQPDAERAKDDDWSPAAEAEEATSAKRPGLLARLFGRG